MSYVVNTLYKSIDFAPNDVVSEVLQNVYTVCSTPVGSVPLDREFGLSMSFIDMPIEQSRALLIPEIIEKVERYETRAIVREIDVEIDERTARMYPVVTIDIREVTSDDTNNLA